MNGLVRGRNRGLHGVLAYSALQEAAYDRDGKRTFRSQQTPAEVAIAEENQG